MSNSSLRRNLDVEGYRDLIALDLPFSPPSPAPDEQAARQALITRLVAFLQQELGNPQAGSLPVGYQEKRSLLKALLTVREPDPLPDWFFKLHDQLLQHERTFRQVVDVAELRTVSEAWPGTGYAAADRTVLWQGDITALKADAIVNAANRQLLGCFQPFHACIDNVIHSAAGPQLREDCSKIITSQGSEEGTGWAKITRGYNLPSNYVLHTVGPIVAGGNVTPLHQTQLAGSYRSCLELAARIPGIRSVAFCSISTGVFGYPKRQAAALALEIVADWLTAHPTALDRVVFNVFQDQDLHIYRDLLSGRP